jgi:hypothetical protein
MLIDGITTTYTKLIPATGKLYGHVENVWGIPFPKKFKAKRSFFG